MRPILVISWAKLYFPTLTTCSFGRFNQNIFRHYPKGNNLPHYPFILWVLLTFRPTNNTRKRPRGCLSSNTNPSTDSRKVLSCPRGASLASILSRGWHMFHQRLEHCWARHAMDFMDPTKIMLIINRAKRNVSATWNACPRDESRSWTKTDVQQKPRVM